MTSAVERLPRRGISRSENGLEVWGGIECTINRVGDEYLDQLSMSGHDARLSDLDAIADLGISTLRYPVLWERVSPREPGERDWRWADERLERLCELAIDPIVGLLHHGSGPQYSSLLAQDFPQLFAEYAGDVAERYPWVRRYTPINEPLTTARFSALYGHWYPHLQTDDAFVCALLNEVEATILAMLAIRRVRPDSELIQTEDFAYVHATRTLEYQASFENQRRWLSFDLLTGRVVPGHPLWTWLLRAGADRARLEWIADHACPPSVVGINYYVTSERVLDERVEAFPPSYHGGNGLHQYADVEASRVGGRSLVGHLGAIRQAWERYELPVALTEVHLGSTRDEQVRWLTAAWQAASRAKSEGADVRALTVWALFGSFDWHCLVTRCDGRYEPGAFDVRFDPPRPTALASLVRTLGNAEGQHPTTRQPGWWERPDRFLYSPDGDATRRLTEGR